MLPSALKIDTLSWTCWRTRKGDRQDKHTERETERDLVIDHTNTGTETECRQRQTESYKDRQRTRDKKETETVATKETNRTRKDDRQDKPLVAAIKKTKDSDLDLRKYL